LLHLQLDFKFIFISYFSIYFIICQIYQSISLSFLISFQFIFYSFSSQVRSISPAFEEDWTPANDSTADTKAPDDAEAPVVV